MSKELIKALKTGRQCDEEGVEWIMSRETCYVAADRIAELEAENERLREALATTIEH